MARAPSDIEATPELLFSAQRDPRVSEVVRLLHLATVPLSLGFLTGQAGHMREWGIEVHALSSPGVELDLFAAREGVHAHVVQMARRITPMRDFLALVRIWRVLRSIRPHIVHAHTPKAGLLGMLAAWFARVPVRIYHIHGLRFITSEGFRRSLLRLTERISCLLAHRVLCVSRSIRDVAIADGVCSAEKIRVLLGGSVNGIDVERFRPADARVRVSARSRLGIPLDAFVVGFIGRVVRDKGIIELAAAWQSLREVLPDLWLLVVGPIEPDDPVPAAVLNLLRSGPRVTLRDLDWNTPPLYAAMDLFVLPSYREGFGLSAAEAAAMGLPVVATHIPGCIDAVQDGVTGTLVPPKNVAALVEAIARYRLGSRLRQEHGAAGRARVSREFRREAIWNATRGEYFALLAERGVMDAGREHRQPWQMGTPSNAHRGEP